MFAVRQQHAEHLAKFHHTNLYLDTFFYNAGVTASNTLWARVSAPTKSGKSHTARMTSGLLTTTKLDGLIADTAEEPEAMALDSARNAERLAALKLSLRPTM